MDSAVPDPPGQPAQDELKGLRALFRKAKAAETLAGSAATGVVAPARPATKAAAPAAPEVRQAGKPRPGRSASPAARRRVLGQLREDPRRQHWIVRITVCLVAFAGFTFWLDWRVGLSAAVVCAAADVFYRSRTSSIVPASARVTEAQRLTARHLKVLHAAGYLALNARKIPGTTSVIDHLVVGPSGVFSLDSELLDKRLELRAIGGMLYHGGRSMEARLDHAMEEADHAADLIGAELGQRVRVRPGMVIYGPAMTWVIMRFKGVDVFGGGRVGSYFRHQTKATRGRQLSSSQIAAVHAAAERALPPLL